MYLLELKIGALVCHSLVANTELAGRRLLGVRLHWGGLGIVKDGLGWNLGVAGETGGRDGIAYIRGVGAHCGWRRTQKVVLNILWLAKVALYLRHMSQSFES
jgi:hypothetical protein